ncbi:MAG: hypothetical protein PHO66_06810 [Eubacteriales bacterium]|nr:hypothetical protein [Eubacteriales bacterium]
MTRQITFVNHDALSAVYFVLLLCGYDPYAPQKEPGFVRRIEGFRAVPGDFSGDFFIHTRQDTCVAYPYWPRTALLESARFYLDGRRTFENFAHYRRATCPAKGAARIFGRG